MSHSAFLMDTDTDRDMDVDVDMGRFLQLNIRGFMMVSNSLNLYF
jgi:hypothetical protein